jgi:hypothetical protein
MVSDRSASTLAKPIFVHDPKQRYAVTDDVIEECLEGEFGHDDQLCTATSKLVRQLAGGPRITIVPADRSNNRNAKP